MKKVFNYLMLVGLPLLGVVGVLRLGESLAPTLCIHGPWKMEVANQSTSSSCQEQFRQSEPLAFSISQSGPRVSISFNNEKKVALQGEIHNTEVSATVPHFSSNSFLKNENDPDVVQLRATLNRATKPAHLWGVLSFSKCPEVNFVAIQQAGSTSEAR